MNPASTAEPRGRLRTLILIALILIVALELVVGVRLYVAGRTLDRELLESDNRSASLRFELEERRDEAVLRNRTAVLRKLSFKKPVRGKVMAREQISEYVRQKLEQTFTPDEIAGYELALKLFGAMPRDCDVKKIITDLYASQAGGFYDPDTGILYRVAGVPLKEVVMAHEFTHALQDQHFDLSSLPMKEKGDDDRALAAQCLVEGDATLVTVDYLLEYPGIEMVLGAASSLAGGGGMKGLDEVPAFFAALIQFPYQAGAEFVQTIKAVGGWKAVDALYADLPASSEHILHIEKYLGRRDQPKTAPESITIEEIRSAVPGGWEYLYDNVLGEYAIFLVMKNRIAPAGARAAAAGWGGDRYRVYVDGERSVLIWDTVWDSQSDAREFFELMSEVCRQESDLSPPDVASGEGRAWLSGAICTALRRDGSAVHVTRTFEPEILRALLVPAGIKTGAESP